MTTTVVVLQCQLFYSESQLHSYLPKLKSAEHWLICKEYYVQYFLAKTISLNVKSYTIEFIQENAQEGETVATELLM